MNKSFPHYLLKTIETQGNRIIELEENEALLQDCLKTANANIIVMENDLKELIDDCLEDDGCD